VDVYATAQSWTGGFTLDDYKAEIDAGRPVLIHVVGHTMTGVGYDETGGSETIYLEDTWSDGPQSMEWGGDYAGGGYTGLTMQTVTVVELDGLGAVDAAVGGTCDSEYSGDGFATIGDTTGLSGAALETTMLVENFDGGSDDWATLILNYSDAELANAGITDESSLRMYWWNTDHWAFEGLGDAVIGDPTGELYDFGVNVDENYAWINIDHASIWTVAQVPEPATMSLLGLGAMFLIRRKRRA
jgi:hypothetical protein